MILLKKVANEKRCFKPHSTIGILLTKNFAIFAMGHNIVSYWLYTIRKCLRFKLLCKPEKRYVHCDKTRWQVCGWDFEIVYESILTLYYDFRCWTICKHVEIRIKELIKSQLTMIDVYISELLFFSQKHSWIPRLWQRKVGRMWGTKSSMQTCSKWLLLVSLLLFIP